MYSINVKFQINSLQKFNFDKFIAENFPGYKIYEYAKNEKGYYVHIRNSVKTRNINNTIIEISDSLEREKDFHTNFIEILNFEITAYEDMQMPALKPAKDDETKSALIKAGKIADIIIEKYAEIEKAKV